MVEKIDFEGRKIRGYAILSKGDTPEKIGQGVYRVPSQSEQGKVYLIAHYSTPDHWSCNCLDYETRKINCKHINSVIFWLSLRKRILQREEIEIPKVQHETRCPFCKSENFSKFGRVKSSKKQRLICKSCKKTFVKDNDFKKFKGNPKVITAVMDLYFKGCSLRKIQDHVKQFYGIRITHVTVYYWIKRFTKLMNAYVEKLEPQVSGMWHIDEQMLNIKKKNGYAWCWNVIDAETRFLIANNITQERSIPEARQVMKKAKTVRFKPDVIVTDGLPSYHKAIRKEFRHGFTPTEHISNVNMNKNPNNNKVERFHNTFRERDKSMRGFQNSTTAQNWADAFRLYYNYIRPHSKFNGLTPSQVAGMKLNLPQNRWEGLLRKSLENQI